jgi:hypothetical protein
MPRGSTGRQAPQNQTGRMGDRHWSMECPSGHGHHSQFSRSILLGIQGAAETTRAAVWIRSFFWTRRVQPCTGFQRRNIVNARLSPHPIIISPICPSPPRPPRLGAAHGAPLPGSTAIFIIWLDRIGFPGRPALFLSPPPSASFFFPPPRVSLPRSSQQHLAVAIVHDGHAARPERGTGKPSLNPLAVLFNSLSK